jgi:hypothetical protein
MFLFFSSESHISIHTPLNIQKKDLGGAGGERSPKLGAFHSKEPGRAMFRYNIQKKYTGFYMERQNIQKLLNLAQGTTKLPKNHSTTIQTYRNTIEVHHHGSKLVGRVLA